MKWEKKRKFFERTSQFLFTDYKYIQMCTQITTETLQFADHIVHLVGWLWNDRLNNWHMNIDCLTWLVTVWTGDSRLIDSPNNEACLTSTNITQQIKSKCTAGHNPLTWSLPITPTEFHCIANILLRRRRASNWVYHRLSTSWLPLGYRI